MCAMSLCDLVPPFVFLLTVQVAVTQKPQGHFSLLENFDHHSLSQLHDFNIHAAGEIQKTIKHSPNQRIISTYKIKKNSFVTE